MLEWSGVLLARLVSRLEIRRQQLARRCLGSAWGCPARWEVELRLVGRRPPIRHEVVVYESGILDEFRGFISPICRSQVVMGYGILLPKWTRSSPKAVDKGRKKFEGVCSTRSWGKGEKI